MKTVLENIKQQIEIYEEALKELREAFDLCQNNHPMAQIRIAQDISLVCAKLDAVKHLYKISGGTK